MTRMDGNVTEAPISIRQILSDKGVEAIKNELLRSR